MYQCGDYDDAVDIVDVWLKEERPVDYYESAADVAGIQVEFGASWVDELINDPMPR